LRLGKYDCALTPGTLATAYGVDDTASSGTGPFRGKKRYVVANGKKAG